MISRLFFIFLILNVFNDWNVSVLISLFVFQTAHFSDTGSNGTCRSLRCEERKRGETAAVRGAVAAEKRWGGEVPQMREAERGVVRYVLLPARTRSADL